MNEAHRLGLKVMVGNVVSLDVGGEKRDIYEHTTNDLPAFLADYATLMLGSLGAWTNGGADCVYLCPLVMDVNQGRFTYREAALVEGTILSMIIEGRAEYPGPFYHSENLSGDLYPGQPKTQAGFWMAVDILGLSGWAVDVTNAGWVTDLTSWRQPGLDDLTEGWRRLIVERFQPFQRRCDKPFLLGTDFGCQPVEGCANYGLACNILPFFDPGRFSPKEVDMYFAAVHSAFKTMVGNYGLWWYAFFFAPYYSSTDPMQYSFRMRIDDLIRTINYGAPKGSWAVAIDGRGDDWEPDWVLGDDPVGDAKGTADISRVYFFQDNDYIYLRVDYVSPPRAPASLNILFDIDDDGRDDLACVPTNLYSFFRDWSLSGDLYRRTEQGSFVRVGFADNRDGDEFIEMRIAKRFMDPYIRSVQNVGLRFMHMEGDTVSDETGYFKVIYRPTL